MRNPTRSLLLTVVLALLVVAPSVRAAAGPPIPQPDVYTYYSLESFNMPGHFVRHRYALGELTTVTTDLDRDDATWTLVPGLAGTGIALRSKNFPSYFLRHHAGRLTMDQSDGSALFREDATFHLRPGNAAVGASWTSLESYNYPGHYVRHTGFHLWLTADDGSTAFAEDSTWALEPPLADLR
ncbi:MULTISPECIES: AbfB domain-containing protein [Actinoplanes]|uniref:AbfB domain-containing protein n=1 Tax=Actinoplanes TaxID=1865 RepID=UPI0006974236|nr:MULTISPECIES: AbfB domain-containing protein [Actinoplanes]GLY06666.1 hypothetical protein Acsp01_70450 [Actinoplanes sp. NBRC 101535]